MPEAEREAGRKKVHASEVPFEKWLAAKGGRADVDGLLPFTRWITPPNVPKRYTTQMYLYFLPLDTEGQPGADVDIEGSGESTIATPKHDGGLEHTSARFLPASKWLELSRAGDIILFPPQFFLLYHVSRFLDGADGSSKQSDTPAARQQRRKQLIDFVKGPAGAEDPDWGDVVISPIALMMKGKDGRGILSLDKAGPELKGSEKRGLKEWVVAVRFKKEGPREVEVISRKEAFDKERDDGKTDGEGYGRTDSGGRSDKL